MCVCHRYNHPRKGRLPYPQRQEGDDARERFAAPVASLHHIFPSQSAESCAYSAYRSPHKFYRCGYVQWILEIRDCLTTEKCPQYLALQALTDLPTASSACFFDSDVLENLSSHASRKSVRCRRLRELVVQQTCMPRRANSEYDRSQVLSPVNKTCCLIDSIEEKSVGLTKKQR